MQFLAPILRANIADYDRAEFYRVLAPIGIVISILLTILAIIGIWEKDQPKYFGIGGNTQQKVKISEYNVVVIVLFCLIPMAAWTATLLAMRNYSLTGEKMKKIQKVNFPRIELKI